MGSRWHALRAARTALSPFARTSAYPASLWQQQLTRAFSALPEHTVLEMPSLSPTMTIGNVASWQKKEGDKIMAGDILADIETDKATLGFDSQDDGYLAKILVPGGSKDVAVGTPICVMVEDGTQVGAFKDYVATAAPAAFASVADLAAAKAAPAAAAAAGGGGGAAADHHSNKNGPAPRHLLTQTGLGLDQVPSSGSAALVPTMITKGDVLAALAQGAKGRGPPGPVAPPKGLATTAAAPAAKAATAAAATAGGGRAANKPKFTDVENGPIRKIIAARLLESKTTIPHMYLSIEANLDALMRMREELKAAGTKVSVNDCVIKAAAMALAEVPEANASWNEAEGVQMNDNVDISMAVSTDKGLITPIIFGAAAKTLLEVSVDAKRLALKARDNKLTPAEFQGGTFSISNLGMFPVDNFCAIINPPQAAIMAVGRGVKKVTLLNGQPSTTMSMVVTVSADNRVFVGDVGAKFLNSFKANMENPAGLMM